ncbi:MAG: cysteine hydrolase family protein [Lachnospiraceae bacterium]
MKDILIVVDMQKDFIDGALGTTEAQAIVPLVLEVIKGYGPEDIYATRDTHQEDYLETLEGKYLPVQHCVRDTDGWQFDRDLKGLDQAHIIDKPSFGSYDLVEQLKQRAAAEPITITMVGLCTDICVVSNALLLKAALPETDIFVYEDCCAGVTPQSHEAAIMTMGMCQIQIKRWLEK